MEDTIYIGNEKPAIKNTTEFTKKEWVIPNLGNIEVEKPTHEMEGRTYATFEGALVDITTVDGRKDPSGGIVLYVNSHDARSIDTGTKSSVEPQRQKVIAEATGSLVISVGQPDITIKEYSNNTPFIRVVENVFNKYDWAAKQMVEALGYSEHIQGKHISVVGFVESCQVAEALIKRLSTTDKILGVTIDQFIQVEPPNRHLLSTFAMTVFEAMKGGHHFKDNDDIPWVVEKPEKVKLSDKLKEKQSRTTLISAFGMRKTTSDNALLDAIKSGYPGLKDTRYSIVTFKDSAMTNRNTIEEYAGNIQKSTELIFSDSKKRHLAKFAYHNIASDKEKLQMEAFHSLRVLKQIFVKGGPIDL